jgi:hypothetical protein
MIINFLFDSFDALGEPNHNLIPLKTPQHYADFADRPADSGFIDYRSIKEIILHNNDIQSPHDIRFINTKDFTPNEKNIYLIQLHPEEMFCPWPFLYLSRRIVQGINEGHITVAIATLYASSLIHKENYAIFHRLTTKMLKLAGITNLYNVVFLFSDFLFSKEIESYVSELENPLHLHENIRDLMNPDFNTRDYRGSYRIVNCNMWEKCILPSLKFYNPHDVDYAEEYLSVEEKPHTFLLLMNNPKPHRYLMYKALEKDGLVNDSIHSYRFNDDWENHNNPYDLGELREILYSENNEILDFKNYMENNPTIPCHEAPDDKLFGPDENGSWDLAKNATYINIEHIKNTFFSILVESSSNSGQSQLTEKTYKLLYYGHPFIMWAPPNSIAELHSLGYKTFPFLFDESYDTMPPETEKLLFIKEQIKQYCGPEGRKKILEKMPQIAEVIRHNRKLFLSKDHYEFWANL